MLVLSLVLFLVFFFILIKSSDFATRYAARLAREFHISEFILSFFIVAIISAFPETAISIISTFEGIPELGLGTLLGSNVADLTLVFGIVALFSVNGISVKSHILREDFLYLFILLFPLILGIDGEFSRPDGVLLLLSCVFFFFTLSLESKSFKKEDVAKIDKHTFRNVAVLIISMICLFVSAHYTVQNAVWLAYDLGVPKIIIGLIILSIGTCLPELMFSLRSVKHNHDALALGDILGTVIIDATAIIGINALIKPFSFNPNIIYITGSAMILAAGLIIFFIRSGRTLTKKEGLFLVMTYIFFIIAELLVKQDFA